MLFGADYYPEHWDRAEWAEHARLMRKANMNVVRIAEFAWKRMEPQEDVFEFSWLDEAIDTLAKEGIKVILGTPTAAPPKWLVNKYDVYMRDKYGRPRGYGSRRECCSNNAAYIERSRIIVERMAEHYADNQNVIAWQTDNEFGCHASTRCYCDSCKRAFAEWLGGRFKDADELNKVYGTVFWSQEYDSFEDVILPAYSSCEPDCGDARTHNPSLELDFYRFSSDSWVKYEKMQADIIRKYTDKPITHNFMGHFSDIDYYKLAEPIDVVSWDNYPENQWGGSEYEYVSMAHEIMRGAKDRNFWVMEEESGPCGWDVFGSTPRPGELRLWTYQAIAHGCEGMIYFRFKPALFGMEQYWMGILDHDGIPRRRYYEIQETGEELQRLSMLFEGAENVSDTLIIKSYENVWSHYIKRHVKDFNYNDELYRWFKANSAIGVNAQCGSADMIYDRYKVIYMPAFAMVPDEIAHKLKEYVSAGGVLVLTYRSGIKDTNNNMLPCTVPGNLRELAGITAQEFDSTKKSVPLTGGYGSSSIWRDIVVPEGAEIISAYDAEFYRGSAAITRNSYGKGTVWYVGCDLMPEAAQRLAERISREAGTERLKHPAGTEVIHRRAKDGTGYYMMLNFTETEKDMCGMGGESLIYGNWFGGKLPPYKVEIIKEFGL